nr:UDP-glycosyltransferase 90A1-like [Tanacetum cinerariifolium]
KVKELMEGEKGKEVRKKVEELRNSAMKAVEEGGPSWRSLNELIDELQNKSTAS